MILDLLPPALVVVVALVPAAVALVVSRATARHAADSAFPERLAVGRKWTSTAFAASVAVLVITASRQWYWALPLLLSARMTAAYFVRRKLLGETWSLAAYFSFFLRLIAASFGFWMLLATSPAIVAAWPRQAMALAAALAVTLAVWGHYYSDAFRTIVGARAVRRPELAARFAALAAACGLPHVWFGEVDLRGGVFANAVALPSIGRPAAVFSSALLDRLTTDEAAAICAHELAHLEHFDRRRLRRVTATTLSLIAIGTLLVPITVAVAPEFVPHIWIVWLPVLLITMALRARNRQQNETSSDLRAVALTGDPDALISALTRLHSMMLVARRWDPKVEQQATHPSLAKRIQAIRAAAGSPGPAFAESIELRDPGGPTSVSLHADRLDWVEGDSISHAIRYDHLSELRVVVERKGFAKLRATTKTGHRFEMTLAAEDVARTQAALDLVDCRLAVTPPPGAQVAVTRIAGIAVVAAGLFLSQIAVALVGLFALAQPSLPTVAAAGTASLIAGVVAWFAPDSDPAVVLLIVCAACLLASGYARRGELSRQLPLRAVLGLSAATALAWLALLSQSGGAWQLHQAARYWTAATILPAALAAAMACARSVRVRVAGVAAAGAAAIAAIFIASPVFVSAFVHDPFIPAGPLPALRVTTIGDQPVRTVSLPFIPEDLRISADGAYIAALTENDDEEIIVRAGRAGGPLARLQADDAMFVDDGRLLVLERRPDGAAVRLLRLDDPVRDEQPPIALPGVRAISLRLTSSTDAWVATAATLDDSLITVTARLGDRQPSQQQWGRAASPTAAIVGVSGQRALLMHTDYRQNLLARSRFWRWAYLLGPYRSASRFSLVGSDGVSRPVADSELAVTCDGGPDLTSTTCAAFDGTTSRLFTFDPGAAAFQPVAQINGHLFMRHVSQDGWVTGWCDSTIVALRPRTREMVRIAPHNRVYAMAASGTRVAVAVPGPDGAALQIYSLPDVSARR